MPASASENPLPPQKTPFTIWQNHLANDLGLSEEELRQRRDHFLTDGVHFQKKGARKLYSAEAEQILRQTLALPLPEDGHAPAAHLAARTPPAPVACENAPLLPVTLKVWRSWPRIRNRHIVEAYVPGADPIQRQNVFRVRVIDNRNFIVGFEFPARLIQAPDLYECTRRAPRFRGRW